MNRLVARGIYGFKDAGKQSLKKQTELRAHIDGPTARQIILTDVLGLSHPTETP